MLCGSTFITNLRIVRLFKASRNTKTVEPTESIKVQDCHRYLTTGKKLNKVKEAAIYT